MCKLCGYKIASSESAILDEKCRWCDTVLTVTGEYPGYSYRFTNDGAPVRVLIEVDNDGKIGHIIYELL